MDKLPQEVMDRLAGHLFPYLAFGGKYDHFQESPGPAEFATISKTWQRTIEAMTFRRLGVLSCDDIPDAKYLLGRDPHRLASVERIDFLIKADDVPAEFPHIRDQKLVQEFHLLINFINEVWTTFTQEPGSLSQLPSCPAVTSLAIYFKEELRRDFLPRDESFAPRKSREAGTALESGRKVPPAWIMNVLAKFPLARQVDYEIFKFILYRQGRIRSNMQQELCNSLGGPAFAHLSNLSLWFGPNNFLSAVVQAFLSHKMIHPSSSMSRGTRATDSLNSALRTLSQQLQELHIHGLFSLSPDLFINRADDADDGNQPFWPRLRVLRVTTTLLTPCGSRWLIPPHRFGYPRRWKRDFTINATLNSATVEFNKLMTALSHGMLNMPRLQLLTLDFLVGPDEPNWHDEDVDMTGNWTGSGQVIGNNAYVPGKTYELVRYVREDNERRNMDQWRGGITEKPAEGYRFCTLAVFNDWFVAGNNRQLYWSPFPEEAVENWNELHKRIKGLTDLEEWRRM
ncbi:hypothetical protein NCU08796 [Neurospora crassa OR74A]|uniref:F-box domain-containing protein n=1 Tax=Neurospora crassa (strain ATCC 24698 / 74-OR23-1A / CBS 708.71 / DSM 1257 / FGSC 987) TaxID=367110 RepID=Q7RWW8_NEUCR|nr:hypothetical protein NCU08796 [Neurospora crassa OR74A]EAA27003.1 hypothetical protein NCU08796 [Neurospora crassa OR74A]|eukprot:XP_956239.1 hypothetical protein NCU08796 [Neurospora crassa OR74A]